MNTCKRAGLVVAILLLAGATGVAQQSGSGRQTLLQRIQGRRDARINRNGNNPQRERQPKLKKIADPSFLDPDDDPLAKMAADNPAIKNAAEIKAQEDLKDQKIKAIKYLAEVGCGCYPGVREALLAALDDCTEEVREEAALAFCNASGNACRACNPDGCCSAEVMNKLAEMAHAKDGNGCYKEKSPEVRAAALAALNACRRVQPPRPAVRKEVPKEVPVEVPERETADPALRGLDTPAEPSEDEEPAPAAPAAPNGEDAAGPTGVVNPVSLEQISGPGGCAVPCPGVEAAKPGLAPAEGPSPFAEEPPAGAEALEEAMAPPPSALAGTYGAAAGPGSASPGMIGDFFGGGTFSIPGINYLGPLPIAGGDRAYKIVENINPYPTDRVFYNYHHFENAIRATTIFDSRAVRDFNFDRHTFGIEKTFLGGSASVEFRVPFGTGLDSTQSYFAPVDTETEFGNVAVTLKAILASCSTWTWTGGVGMTFPTADDFKSTNYDPTYGDITIFQIANQSVHVQPFTALIWEPNDVLFGQAYVACDMDANGNAVLALNNNDSLVRRARFTNQSWMSYDVKLGFWAYRDPCRIVRGIAPTVELHYTTTVSDADEEALDVYGFASQSVFGDYQDVLNLTAGVHCLVGEACMANFYAAVPLRRDTANLQNFVNIPGRIENSFDVEFGLQMNVQY